MVAQRTPDAKHRQMSTFLRRKDTTPPWKKAPRNAAAKKLTPAQKKQARARARAAGRTYPNLVDNMAVASRKRRRRQ
jgi:hypothetical protein